MLSAVHELYNSKYGEVLMLKFSSFFQRTERDYRLFSTDNGIPLVLALLELINTKEFVKLFLCV